MSSPLGSSPPDEERGRIARRGGLINCRAFFLYSVWGMTYAVKSRRLVVINCLCSSV